MTTVTTVYAVRCDKCTKTVEANDSRMNLFKKALKAGWAWLGSNSQLCPAHNTKKVKTVKTKSVKAAKKSVKKSGKAKAIRGVLDYSQPAETE